MFNEFTSTIVASSSPSILVNDCLVLIIVYTFLTMFRTAVHEPASLERPQMDVGDSRIRTETSDSDDSMESEPELVENYRIDRINSSRFVIFLKFSIWSVYYRFLVEILTEFRPVT